MLWGIKILAGETAKRVAAYWREATCFAVAEGGGYSASWWHSRRVYVMPYEEVWLSEFGHLFKATFCRGDVL